MAIRKILHCLTFAGTLTLLAPVSADTPLPTLLPGERLNHENVPFKNQFAPPLPGPDGSIYVFADTSRWQLWPFDESRLKRQPLRDFLLPNGPRLGYSESYPARYASVATVQGSWLIGPTVELIRADGSRLSGKLKWPRNHVKALALGDGSVLAVGGYSWPEARDFSYNLKVERVWLDAGNRIQSEELPPIPVDLKGSGVWESLDGYSVALTGNGQVLLAGSEYRNLSLLFDPVKRSWRKLASTARARSNPALILLPDGRIWATGGQGWRVAETTSDLWDPRTQAWSQGPDLPVPMVDHRAVLSENRDAVLLAGGYYPTVLGWRMGSEGVFVAAQHAVQRRHAGLFALPGQRLALTGGRHARQYGEGWGRTTPGMALVPLELGAAGKRQPVWPSTRDGALLENRGQLLAVGGLLHHSHNGSDEDSGTRLVERIDIAKGLAHTLPPLPLTAGSTQAAWIGEQDVLVQAENAGSEKEARQWLGVLNQQTGAQRPLPLPPNPTYIMSDGVHRRMQLVGAHAGRGWLIAEDGETLLVSPKPPYYEPTQRMQRQRQGFTGRVLSDGRVIIAGGNVESELVAARPANCQDCSVRYIGFGPLLPSRRHEIYDPQTAAWSNSTPSRASGGPVGIFADGRVAKLGEYVDKKAERGNERPTPLLEISDAAGKAWRILPLPPGYPAEGSQSTTYLQTVRNDTPYLARALFVGFWQNEEVHWWWLEDVDATSHSWRSLGKSVPPYAFPPGELDSGQRVSNGQGERIVFVGGSAGVISYLRQ